MYVSSLLFFAATAAGLASAAPTNVKRQTPPSCTVISSGRLAVRPASNSYQGPVTWAGIVSGVKHTGIDGGQDSIIVTKDDNGNQIGPQEWEFVQCTDDNGHAPPPGYVAPTFGPTSNTFGIIRPSGATQHCLAVESTNDASTNARNSILDSYCTQVPEQYRLWMRVSYTYDDDSYGQHLFFANQNMSTIIGPTKHAELQFFTNDQTPPGEQVTLMLLPTQ